MFLTFSLMIPLVYLLHDRNKQRQHIAHLHEETLKSELNLLKSQINPHFFFNTLNNLYGLATEKSELTQEVIYKLSQMMRFTIYEGRKNTVTLADEVDYLENFIELNIIRYKHKIDIKFEQKIEDKQQRIPPLLFINLLENAFKHGVDSQLESQYIHFSLTTTKTTIMFNIENNFDKITCDKNKAIRRSGGLGTENLSRRLALLFPNKHSYTRYIEGNQYIANVTINLA
ncbi:sensor histidine kinase [Thalassotalea sp. PP2-459]|uniref:sensor histidine kinase n=1 Tax=Thalassotalea sp. PP2-459 TaxID=1742724 RepID=UPI000945BE9F|nr:sensor histidine kinase [Thalassotalea sp. PP2-459]OKY25377.1 hypothetical protein BI291_03345 [Thalassotalea sp. PP2-459]